MEMPSSIKISETDDRIWYQNRLQKNAAKFVVHWMRLDILVDLSVDSRGQIWIQRGPSPAHPPGFSFCNFSGFLAIFNVVTSQQQKIVPWICHKGGSIFLQRMHSVRVQHTNAMNTCEYLSILFSYGTFSIWAIFRWSSTGV